MWKNRQNGLSTYLVSIIKIRLNVGCGTDPYGDIRIDIIHQRSLYETKNTLNLFADAHNLPLRDKTIDESRCFHVLEHLESPKKGLNELKRVTKESINIRVPVWHPYSFLIEAIQLIKTLLIGRPKQKFNIIKQILNWRIRYSDHKYYIKPSKAKINRKFLIPREYEATFYNRIDLKMSITSAIEVEK